MSFKVDIDKNLYDLHIASIFKIPRYDNFPDQSGLEGEIIYNRTDGFFYGYDGTVWAKFDFPLIVITLSTEGSGESLIFDGVAPNFKLKGLETDGTLVITGQPDTVDITITGGGADNVSLASVGSGESLVNDGTGPDLAIKGLPDSTNISFSGTTDYSVELNNNIIVSTATTPILNIIDGGTQKSNIVTDVVGANVFCIIPSSVSNSIFAFEDNILDFSSKILSRSLNTFTNLNLTDTDFSVSAAIDNNKLQFFFQTSATYGWGDTALANPPSLTNNVAIGTGAGNKMDSSTNNIIFGHNAGLNVITGDNEICIGSFSGSSITSASDGIIIGDQALSTLAVATLQSVVIGTNAARTKPSSGSVQSVIIGYHDATHDFGNLCIQIGWKAGQSGNGNMVSNMLLGYNVLAANASATTDTNTLFGANILNLSTGSNATNSAIGSAIFNSVTTQTCSQNVIMGANVLSSSTGTSSNNVLLGYNCVSNLTTGRANSTILVGDSLTANAVGDVLSNVAAFMPNASTLPSTVSNLFVIGNSSMDTLLCLGTNFTTDGVVVSTSNQLSSETDVSQQTTFSAGIKSNTIDEVTADTGVTLDGLVIKDSAVQFVSPLSTYIQDTLTTPNYSGIWAITYQGNIYITKIGRSITLTATGVIQTASASSFITSGTALNAAYRPFADVIGYCVARDNAVYIRGVFVIKTTGIIEIYANDYLGTFSGSGGSGFQSFSVTYST